MNRESADILAEGLQNSVRPHSINTSELADKLRDTVTTIPGFSKRVGAKISLVNGSDNLAYLSLLYVLDNSLAETARISKLTHNVYGFFNSKGMVSDDQLYLSSLRSDGQIMDMLSINEHPYSLLALRQSYNHKGGVKVFDRVTPLLVVPDCKNVEPVINWQNRNSYSFDDI